MTALHKEIMASTITDLETTINGLLANVSAINKRYKYEPLEIVSTPATTLFFDRFDDNYWYWILRLYVSLKDAQTAQSSVKTIIPDILSQVCTNEQFYIETGNHMVVTARQNPMLVVEFTVKAMRSRE